jgi:hypothetical protein
MTQTTIPSDVDDNEVVVRCVCSPFHYSKGKLHWKAFQPKRGRDDVSVIRADYVGPHVCKVKGKELAAAATPEDKKAYEGLAVIAAGAVRICGAGIVDSREHFLGHADIKHGYGVTDYEPEAPEIIETVRERCKRLLKFAAFFPDPAVDSEGWTGPALVASAAWVA